jgi:hypothetical protein
MFLLEKRTIVLRNLHGRRKMAVIIRDDQRSSGRRKSDRSC